MLNDLWNIMNNNSKGDIFLVIEFKKPCLLVLFPCISMLHLPFGMMTTVFVLRHLISDNLSKQTSFAYS